MALIGLRAVPFLQVAPTLAAASRQIASTSIERTVFDPKVFREPIVDLEELKKPLHKDDDRNFLYIKPMKADESPVFYKDRVIDKFIRVVNNSGRKELARWLVYSALEIVKRNQYKEWLKAETQEEKDKIELDPFKIANVAIRNCRPMLKLLPVMRGGTVYSVPSPMPEKEAEFRGMKMLRDVCREKAKHGVFKFEQILSIELLAAYRNEGLTIKQKQELHKTCEANRAYIHYRKMN